MLTILFYRSSGLAALLTRLWTWQWRQGQKWADVPAHIAIAMPDGYIYEAVSTGIQRRQEERVPSFLPLPGLQVVDVANVDTERALTFLEAQIGKRYDWLAIAADVLGRAFPLLAIRDMDNDKWTCSRLAAQALTEGGLTLPDCRLPMSPNDLLLFLEAQRDRSSGLEKQDIG